MAPQIEFTEWLALTQLYAEYAAAVDSGNWDTWPDFFTDDCVYRLQPRENFERGFPLATLSFTSKGMLKDRVYAVKETLFHDPYYQRHVVEHYPSSEVSTRSTFHIRGQLRGVPHEAVGDHERIQCGSIH